MTPERLESIVERQSAKPLAPEIQALAEAIRARHEPGVVAVLAYGSSLRGVGLSDTLIDLYVLTDSGAAVSRNRLARLGCRLVPPNVHYGEARIGTVTLRAKYAVLPLETFVRKLEPEVANPYFWARFAQPCRIAWVQDDGVRRRLVAGLAQAVRTMVAASLPLAQEGEDALELWRRGFAETYRTELRPESDDRAQAIVAADAAYYESVTRAVLEHDELTPTVPLTPAQAGTQSGLRGPAGFPLARERASGGRRHTVSWRRRRIAGRALSALRLLKAAFTFEGGADYVAWKIARHSGQAIDLKPWQRRHPVLGALWLLPGLLRRGAVR
jgi:hypothetical protein